MRGSGRPVSQRRAAPHIRLTRTQSYKSDNLELVSELSSRLMVMWVQTLQHSLSVSVRGFRFRAKLGPGWCEGWPKDVLFRSCHRHCISLSINFHSAEIESVVIKIYLKYSHIFGRLLITLIVMAGPDTMSALGAGPRVSEQQFF